MLKKLVWAAILVITLFATALNTGLISTQAEAWVAAHPQDPHSPEVLYYAARWCDILGADDTAIKVYWDLYQQYPDRGDLCAPALYHCAYIMDNGSYIVAIRKEALKYVEIIMDQYPDQGDWSEKAKAIYDEVNYVH